MKHLDIKVIGRVQGVSFRATAKAVADQLGVRGTVRNLEDDSVGIEAEGTDSTLELFLDFCHDGSDYADVTAVEVTAGELKNYRNFEVLKR